MSSFCALALHWNIKFFLRLSTFVFPATVSVTIRLCLDNQLSKPFQISTVLWPKSKKNPKDRCVRTFCSERLGRCAHVNGITLNNEWTMMKTKICVDVFIYLFIYFYPWSVFIKVTPWTTVKSSYNRSKLLVRWCNVLVLATPLVTWSVLDHNKDGVSLLHCPLTRSNYFASFSIS